MLHTGFPQGLENRENRENKSGQGKVREMSGNNFYIEMSGKSQGIFWPKSLIHYFIKQNGSGMYTKPAKGFCKTNC